MFRKAFFVTLAALLTGAAAATAAERATGRAGSPPPATAGAWERLLVEPSEAALVGPRAHQGLLVSGLDLRGRRRDLTASARFVSLDPRVARVTSTGQVFPIGDGTAVVKAVIGNRVAFAAI